MWTRPRRPRGGFTLIELLIVMTIIGLIVAFILTAGYQGLRAAESRATVALIAKLDQAVADRMDALLALSPEVAPGHQALAAIPGVTVTPGAPSPFAQRAYTIALADMFRAEMIDVFLIDTSNANYPVNFAATPFPSTATGDAAFVLPLGAGATVPITGMYGASFSARAGIAKGLGNQPDGSSVTDPRGYNGWDDDGDGLIDEFDEWTLNTPANATLITANMGRHTHKTARSEALYAMLTEGNGPLGSYFSADDFTSREVKDTDGDGLLEFVDAWGEPLQFFRWPIYFGSEPGETGVPPTYGSDLQKGFYPYVDATGSLPEPREQNPLDPNQQLVAPAWFSGLAPGTAPTAVQAPGTNAQQFQALFFSVTDPQSATGSTGLWDRSRLYQRRAYAFKPLILSSGPDKLLGVGLFTNATVSAAGLVQIENQAARADLTRTGTSSEAPDRTSAATLQILEQGQDDLTNHGSATTGAIR